MVGGYQRTANEERAAAKSWSNVTVGAMLILIAAAVLTLLTAPPAVTWPYLAIRAFVATAVAILATYAGRRAGAIETRNDGFAGWNSKWLRSTHT